MSIKLGSTDFLKFYAGTTSLVQIRLGADLLQSWSPTGSPGLTVWLDASQLGLADGAAVTSWPDLSGGNHPGTVVGSPAPTVRANTLNGLPVVRFAAGEGRVRGGGMCAEGGYDVTIIYVGRMVGPTVGRIFSGVYPPFNFLVGAHLSGEPQMYDNGWVSENPIFVSMPTPWRMYEAFCSGSPIQSHFYVNGEFRGFHELSNGHDSKWAISGYTLDDSNETCDCEVAELLTWDRRLTYDEQLSVEDYLRTKWGL